MKDKMGTKIVVSVLIFGLLIGIAGYYVGRTRFLEAAEKPVAIEDTMKLEGKIKEGARALEMLENKTRYSPKMESYHYTELEAKGIADPQVLIDDLKSKPELIPVEPVLGGTMHFTMVALLDDSWVYSRFEDGHIGGKAIFKWTKNGDEIQWKLLLVEED